jgi:hypothetical protein
MKIVNCKLKIGLLLFWATIAGGQSGTARAEELPSRKTENVILITYDGLR